MKFEEIITDRLILREFTQESFDSIYSDMSQDEQLDILGLNSIEKLLEEKEKYKKGLSTHNKKFLYHQLIDKKTNTILDYDSTFSVPVSIFMVNNTDGIIILNIPSFGLPFICDFDSEFPTIFLRRYILDIVIIRQDNS